MSGKSKTQQQIDEAVLAERLRCADLVEAAAEQEPRLAIKQRLQEMADQIRGDDDANVYAE